MADNVDITPGIGATVAADLISGALHQRVKLSLGVDGVAVDAPGEGTNGMDVDVTRLPALVAGTAVIGKVGIDQTTPGTTNLVALAANQTVDVTKLAGTAVAVNSGNKDAGTQRVVIATDQPNLTSPLNIAFTKAPMVYSYNIPSQVHIASANALHWDMFNGDAALVVRVLSIRQIPNVTTAVTGIVFDWLLERTTAVGTGGSTLTAWLADLNDTALDADITARSKPTGGATQSTDLYNYSISSEETTAATIHLASIGGLELVPPTLLPQFGGKGIVLRQNQGLRCVQITNSLAGNTGWMISFTVE